MLGLQRGTVALEAHNAEWEALAAATVKRLKAILRARAVDVQHIGSTAIRSVSAKPILDIVVGVRAFDEILALNDVLHENGFLFRGQDHPDQYLYVCGEGDLRTHHVHVVLYGSKYWSNYLNLRDYLNSHDEDARAYSELKEALARQYALDRGKYTAMKSAFIQELLNKARVWRQECDE